jgi:hypothetical protein
VPIYRRTLEAKLLDRENEYGVVDVAKLVHEPCYIDMDGEYYPSVELTVKTYVDLLVSINKIESASTYKEKRVAAAYVIAIMYPLVEFEDIWNMDTNRINNEVNRITDMMGGSAVSDFLPIAVERGEEGEGRPSGPMWFGRLVADVISTFGFPHSDVMEMGIGWFWNYVANRPAIEAAKKIQMVEAFTTAMAQFQSKEGARMTNARLHELWGIASRGEAVNKKQVPKQHIDEMSDKQLQVLKSHPFMGKFITTRKLPS